MTIHDSVTTTQFTPPENVSLITKDKNVMLRVTKCTEDKVSTSWTPPALRAPVLGFTIFMCWALIAILEFFLWKSQKHNGVIFAPRINDLPLKDTFLYLYFPTIFAVLFSIYWAWIDLEAKRIEPYYQLSKEGGALGKDSILLHYPFDFLPFVPFKAFKNRHWPVFCASFAIVLVTWGLVPTQAGIFSTRTIRQSTNITFALSTSAMPFEKQALGLSFRYTQSTYAIATLNETLPEFMERNFTLAPFAPSANQSMNVRGGTYTAPTTMYFLDLSCEQAIETTDEYRGLIRVSKNGCSQDLGPNGNKTVGGGSQYTEVYRAKQYDAIYVGYHNGGFAHYYLSSKCPKTANTTFYAALTKNKAKDTDPPHNVTAIFCHPRYWRQEVSATVDMATKAPLKVDALNVKEPLPWYIFNTTNFESLLNSGSLGVRIREDVLPTQHMPTYRETIANTDLNLDAEPMVGLALASTGRSFEEYLDWKALANAYQDAYQLMFSRAMVDVLANDQFTNESTKKVDGQQLLETEAVVLEPIFVHIVVGFLGVVSIATIALLVTSTTRRRNLRTDPCTIASVMSLVADSHGLLYDLASLDCCTSEDVQTTLGQKRYKLVNDDAGVKLVEVENSNDMESVIQRAYTSGPHITGPDTIAKPVRPMEFSLWVAFPFINLFVVLAILLGIIFGKARANGLPLPSSNAIVQNFIENYIPTALATMIEPMWILINRLLCMLQPLEELRSCNAKPSKSIDLDYASLPPQLVIFKALRSKHFVLAAVCTMALLANLLAVAFAGIFKQNPTEVHYASSFDMPFQYKVVSINGSVGPDGGGPSDYKPSGAFRGGDGQDQFLIAESNFTRNTSLPAWTDDRAFYLPAFSEDTDDIRHNSTDYQFAVNALGAELDCTELKFGKNFEASITEDQGFMNGAMSIVLPGQSGDVRCSSPNFHLEAVPRDKNHCVPGGSSLEFVTILQPRVNATQQEREICMANIILAWLRDPPGSCAIFGRHELGPEKSLFIQCRPRVVTGTAKIRVDRSGQLQRPASDFRSESAMGDNMAKLFSNDPVNLIGQSNAYLFKNSEGSGFHNNTIAYDNINYFISRVSNSKRLIDPKEPVPAFSDVIGPLQKTYSKLFAIWLATNKKKLLLSTTKETPIEMRGSRIEIEQRLFVSVPLFLIAEVILCTYAIVAIWVYLRRPGQYLARLPTSVAAVIALFAASAAVQDMQGTSHLDKKERGEHLEKLNSRYGYGSFLGFADGRVHIGIDKTPFVRRRKKTTWLERKRPLLRGDSDDAI